MVFIGLWILKAKAKQRSQFQIIQRTRHGAITHNLVELGHRVLHAFLEGGATLFAPASRGTRRLLHELHATPLLGIGLLLSVAHVFSVFFRIDSKGVVHWVS